MAREYKTLADLQAEAAELPAINAALAKSQNISIKDLAYEYDPDNWEERQRVARQLAEDLKLTERLQVISNFFGENSVTPGAPYDPNNPEMTITTSVSAPVHILQVQSLRDPKVRLETVPSGITIRVNPQFARFPDVSIADDGAFKVIEPSTTGDNDPRIAAKAKLAVHDAINKNRDLRVDVREAVRMDQLPLFRERFYGNDPNVSVRISDALVRRVDARIRQFSTPRGINLYTDSLLDQFPDELRRDGEMKVDDLREWSYDIRGMGRFARAADRAGRAIAPFLPYVKGGW